jgi:pimeloyl-ACP methyl ester carboxylesterase
MLSLVAQLSRSPAAPLRIWLRTTGHKIRPPLARSHVARVRHRQDAVLASGAAGPHQFTRVLTEPGLGPQPTIVVGGFVPDAMDALYLLRGGLLRQGSLYTLSYPCRGFSTDLFLAQLADLIEELTTIHRRPPVLIGISFGAGLVLELLRRATAQGTAPGLAGLVLVSPVAGVADLIDPATPKPTTLLGRVLKPYLDASGPADPAIVERSRGVFLKMFESGAQNRAALGLLLTQDETRRLRDAVHATINSITPDGVVERVRALREFSPLREPRCLSRAPALILYAEKESSVLPANSPTEQEFRGRIRAWLPQGLCLTVRNTPDNPVQHASLIFHAQNFEPLLAAFYRQIRHAHRRAA